MVVSLCVGSEELKILIYFLGIYGLVLKRVIFLNDLYFLMVGGLCGLLMNCE